MKDISIDAIVENALEANKIIAPYIYKTALERNDRLSEKYNADIWLKREDKQVVRSFKLRGALNKLMRIDPASTQKLVCASAGNHAQGFAYSCNLLRKEGIVFMPITTSEQKKNQVKRHGKEWVVVELYGDTVDSCLEHAMKYTKENGAFFIHPFNDPEIIAGQATIGLEILEQSANPIDYLLVTVGGGGLISGVSSVFHKKSPSTKIIGCEPLGAASLQKAMEAGKPIRLSSIDTFVDGAAVAQIGDYPFSICKETVSGTISVPEGHICTVLLELYNQDAIVAEPAGALAIAALDFIPPSELKGKTICIILSGGNNDILRMQEIKERSLLYEKLKYYFIVEFPQRPGALKDFLHYALEEGDDIVLFEYMKKTNKERGPALIGIETKEPNQQQRLSNNIKKIGFKFQELNDNLPILSHLI